jgi:hypothetical protein
LKESYVDEKNFLFADCFYSPGHGLRVPASPAYPARDPVRQSRENRPADFSQRQFTLIPRARRKKCFAIWVRSLSGRDDRQITDEQKRGIRHYTWAYDNKHDLRLITPSSLSGERTALLISAAITDTVARLQQIVQSQQKL